MTMTDHVKILLVGDEAVGKSSLLSTYLSKHFPSAVPAMVMDSTIPAEKTANGVCVTIMDSSLREMGLDTLRQRVQDADVVVALYDASRPDTLRSLSQFWLPFIQITFSATAELYPSSSSSSMHTETTRKREKPVLVAATKTDLTTTARERQREGHEDNEDDEEERAERDSERERETLAALLKDFPFVLMCLRCSAKRCEEIDTLFYYAELVVTFPVTPLLDLQTHEFTPRCRCALQRVFRVFDEDGDGVLSDAELARFQCKCFDLAMSTEEVRQIKRIVEHLAPCGGIVRDGVAFDGLLALLMQGVKGHELQIPWTILRRFHYDNDLQLNIPPEILSPPPHRKDQLTELSPNAREFLLSLARAAYAENTRPVRPDSDTCSELEDCLTSEALKSIFSVLPRDATHPWATPPTFQMPWLPAVRDVRERAVGEGEEKGEGGDAEEKDVRAIEQTMLLSDMPHATAHVYFDRWLQHWNQLALCDPVLTQKLLFQIGYVERGDLGVVVSSSTIERLQAAHLQKNKQSMSSVSLSRYLRGWSTAPPSSAQPAPRERPRSLLRVAVFGDNRVGKSSFVWTLSELLAPGSKGDDVELQALCSKPIEHIVVGACTLRKICRKNERGMSWSSVSSDASLNATTTRKKDVSATSLQSHVSVTVSPLASPQPGNASVRANNGSADAAPYLPNHYHASFAAVPLEHFERWCSESVESCDLAVLMFQCESIESLETSLDLERQLPPRLPRCFVATKADLLYKHGFRASQDFFSMNASAEQQELRRRHELVQQTISLYTQEHHLPAAVLCSTSNVDDALQLVRKIAHNPTLGIPARGKTNKPDALSRSTVLVVSSLVCAASLSFLAVKYREEIQNTLKDVLHSVQRLIGFK